jgi:hypothetical protein
MRTSIVSRLVVAAASLAVGSAALVASPARAAETATAATPAGVTREAVLTVANAFRTQQGDALAAYRAMFSIVNRACAVDADGGERIQDLDQRVTSTRNQADGVVIFAEITNLLGQTTRECVVAAVAAVEPGFTLTGSSTFTVTTSPAQDPGPIVLGSTSIAAGPATITTPLSGDVVTATVNVPAGEQLEDASFSAAGSAVKVTTVTTTKRIADKKSKAEKKAAKKTYAKRLKAAKKAYAKALDRAGGSTSRKAAAKKAYTKRKASAKAKYAYAVAGYRIVRKKTQQTDRRPFSVSTPTQLPL